MRVTKLVSVTAAVLILSAIGGPTDTRAAASLSGAGSDLVAPLVAEWATDLQSLHAVTVSFNPTPGAQLPALKITPVYRRDSSTQTSAFTSYLSVVDRSWRKKIGHGTTVGFPTGVPATGNVGVTSTLRSSNGSIGYAAVSFLIAHGVAAAAIRNAAGRFEYPNLSNIEDAAQTVKAVPASDALTIIYPSRRARVAYPISTFSYVIVPVQPPQRWQVTRWLRYTLGAGRSFGPSLDFPPLPSVVLKAAEATVRKLQ